MNSSSHHTNPPSSLLSTKTFQASLSILYEMLSIITEKAKQCRIPAHKIRHIELSCEEVLVNIISYAYPKTVANKPISVSCHHSNSIFEVCIKDKGKPFNPLTKTALPFNSSNPLSGGLGILLMKNYCDNISYNYLLNENCLSLKFSVKM